MNNYIFLIEFLVKYIAVFVVTCGKFIMQNEKKKQFYKNCKRLFK